MYALLINYLYFYELNYDFRPIHLKKWKDYYSQMYDNYLN